MKSSVPKIAMMTTLGVNVGDEFIRDGIISFLEEILPRFKLFYVNKHDLASLREPRMDETEILGDKFLDSDVIIQAGAPVYWKLPTGSTCYNVEWAEELWYKRIFRLGDKKIILNVGAGSCLPYGDSGAGVTGDPGCVEFIRSVSASCRWVSVRDPVAGAILDNLGLRSEKIACPAFHAARRFKTASHTWGDVVGLNLMPLSGHFSIAPEITEDASIRIHRGVVDLLRRHHRLMFIAHTSEEARYMERYRLSGEVVFTGRTFRDYYPVYSACRAVFANRVHGAVCAAGFGIPAMIAGNDSRLQIADYIGLPRYYAGFAEAAAMVDDLEELLENEEQETDRLLTLREGSAQQYLQGLAPILRSLQ